ncbi:protein kinase [bacterium]|nr:protein kinase [bacterium]
MSQARPKSIEYRGRREEVLEVFRIRGRNYFAVERLSRRGTFRVFDPHAAPGGDFRVLAQIPAEKFTGQKIETLRRIAGPNMNPNFPVITHCVRERGDWFIVMTWVWGIDLREYLARVRRREIPRPSVTEVCRLIRGLSHGLAHYHRKSNLVHGDISPANIILTTPTTRLVLIDFGSAWPIELSTTKVRGDGVTSPYAAPERIAGHALEDFRADLFSLWTVFYELLTLDIPFDAAGGRAGIPANIEQFANTFVPPSQLVPDRDRLPKSLLHQLDNLLRIGLALHPDARFSTPKEWLNAVDRIGKWTAGDDGSFSMLAWLTQVVNRWTRLRD